MTTTPPIDPNQAMTIQSREALMRAHHQDKLVVYRWPVDMTDQAVINDVLAETGPRITLPDDTTGVYYFLYVIDTRPENTPADRADADDAEDDWVPFLVPEGEVIPFLTSLAMARGGPALAYQYTNRVGVMPAA